MTVRHTTRTYTGGRLEPALLHLMAAEQNTERRLLTPDEALRLPADDLLIFVAGHAPIYGKKIKYYQDREFSRRARLAAPTAAHRHPTAQENTAAAEPPTPLSEDGTTRLPPPVPPVEGPDTTRRPGPPGPPNAPELERHAPRSWRRRTVLTTDQEIDRTEPAIASPEEVAVQQPVLAGRPARAHDPLDSRRRATETQPARQHPPQRERGKEQELGR